MKTEDLVRQYPEVYHMAEVGSWPSIRQRGLLSTSALLDLYGYTGEKRRLIESEWRPKKVTIHYPDYGKAVIRDQKVMRPDELRKCLVGGMTPTQWYHLINAKTFFWATWDKSMIWFLGAEEYKNKVNLVITVDTAGLVKRHASQIRLSSINSGSTLYRPPRTSPRPRGRDTFKKIPDYSAPFVVELAVEYAIPDIVEFTVSIADYISDGIAPPKKIQDIPK